MKSLIFTAILGLTFGTASYAAGVVEYGVSLITAKTDSNDEYQVTGVLFADYDGYAYDITEDKTIDLVETSLELSVDGKNVKVYTNLATYNYYGLDGIELNLTGVSLSYDKVDDYAIQNKKKLTIVSASAVKFLDLGLIQVDLIGGISLGGVTKATVQLMDDQDDSGILFEDSATDRHYGTIDFSVGTDVNIVDDVNLYMYAGVLKQFGKNTEESGIHAGAVIYGSEIAEGIDQEFIVKYEKKTIDYKDALKSVEDSAVWFMYRVTF